MGGTKRRRTEIRNITPIFDNDDDLDSSATLEKPKGTNERDSDSSPGEHVVLVVGSCGLDRLLTTTKFPAPDSKVRSTAYHEVGGGNAANTASAMGLLQSAALWKRKMRIKFLTTVGDDLVGQKLVQELEGSNVDTTSPLFCVRPNSTTAITTIIVELENHTRTCIHTPGTCGELSSEDFQSADMDQVFQNVRHIHSDSRHTEVSLLLAQEAKKRGIPVSVDCEKDRKSAALDSLMELSDLVFTNSNYLGPYLRRLEQELESENGRMHLPAPLVIDRPESTLKKDTVEVLVNSLVPSAFFTRWYGQTKKEIIVTQGSMGALHYQPICTGLVLCSIPSVETTNNLKIISAGNCIHLRHEFQDCIQRNPQTFTATDYKVHQVGVFDDVQIVDSTGAGDAFIGGYLMALLGESNGRIQFSLEFASWVSARKLEGPGARSSLPKGADVDDFLGIDAATVGTELKRRLSTFNDRN